MSTPQPEALITAEDVYQILRKEIMTLRLAPGTMLSENTIVARFGLSRTPVRAVISRLAQEGLLVQQGRKGNYVSLIDLDLAEQIIYLRIQLEESVFCYLIRHPDAMLYPQLRRNLEQQQAIVDRLLPDSEFFRIDSEFHALCMASAGRLRAWQMIQSMDVHYSRYRQLDYSVFRGVSALEDLLQNHQELLGLLVNRDEAAVKEAVYRHLYSGMIRISNNHQLYDTYSSYFASGARDLSAILRDVRLQLRESQH